MEYLPVNAPYYNQSGHSQSAPNGYGQANYAGSGQGGCSQGAPNGYGQANYVGSGQGGSGQGAPSGYVQAIYVGSGQGGYGQNAPGPGYQAGGPAYNQGVQPAPPAGFVDLKTDPHYMTVKDWVITYLLMMIPAVGFILILIWAFSIPGEPKFQSRKTLCQAVLIIALVMFAIAIIIAVVTGFTLLNMFGSAAGSSYNPFA